MWEPRDEERTAAAGRASTEPDLASLAMTAAEMGEFEWDRIRDRIFISERMARITGRQAGEGPALGGAAVFEGVHPDDRPGLDATIARILESGERYEARFRHGHSHCGRDQWLFSAGMAERDESGVVSRVIGVVRDITVRKEQEDEREALVAELDHRVKNVLASVQSLAAQSARRTVSLEAFLRTFGGRLEAMAAAHTLLTTTRWRGADIGNIAAAELGGLAFGQARWEGPEIVLNPRATGALTLALHELGSNAIKYGALSTETGRVEVRWQAEADGGFSLTWTEMNGPPVTPPARLGFGHTLLEKVTGRELGGEVRLDFRRGGLHATLQADASALAEAPQAPAPMKATPAMAVEEPRPRDATLGESVGERNADGIVGKRVLIVEDAVLLALELESGLNEAGAQVVGVAADLEEAERMVSLTFDAAVLDANLNGKSVLPVARILAARGTPFIFATGYDEAGVAPEGFNVPIVRKPYNVRQIAAALVQAMSAV